MTKEKIVDYINSMNTDEIVALHNSYCEAANCMDDCIYGMEELEEVLDGVEKWNLVNMIRHGDFDFMKDFWQINVYGNLDSYNAWELPIFAKDIADYILSEDDSLNDDKIQEILDEEGEE